MVLGDPAGAEPLRSLDPLTPLHRIRGGRPAAAGPVAVPLTAAEQLGTATPVCEPATQHARTREQFGRPVGAFQAVAHLCAGMLVRAETARAAVHAAAVTADRAERTAARSASSRAAAMPTGHLGVGGPSAPRTGLAPDPLCGRRHGE